jgi:RNA polymerase sigma-70 factor (ECF subfamily)
MIRSNATWLEELGGSGAVQEEALTALRELLLSGLRRSLGQRRGVDEAFLEDVVQSALVKILKHFEAFEGRSRFTTWATAIAIRAGLTELRRRHWKDVSLDEILDRSEGKGVEQVDPSVGPDRQAEGTDMISTMYGIIHKDLTEKQRTALLAELKGLPQAEIGRRMGRSRNAIYKLTHDARKRLRRGLEAAGYSVADLQVVFER